MAWILGQWRVAGGLGLGLLVYWAALQVPALSPQAALVAGLTGLCAAWWITEAVPIPVTSLIPIAILPLLSILTPTEVAEAYGNPIILLLMGGCILSTAMERSGAHEKVALLLVHAVGGSSTRHVVFGFMAAAAILSMWISNTATTLMLLPVAMAVLQRSRQSESLAVPLLLGICYAASIGGMGTPIGTPPNLILLRVLEEGGQPSIGFLTWMLWCVPVVVVFVPVVGWWLCRKLQPEAGIDLPEQRGWSVEQKRVLMVFGLTALAWVTRTEPFGGWRTWLDLPQASDASVALIAVVAMFLIPNGRGERLLDWNTAVRIPWGMLLLFSGGIALAKAFISTGLADFLAGGLGELSTLPVWWMMLLVCLAVTFLTEVTSNTASTSLLMPVLLVAAIAADMDPLIMMLPAALSASCAFMLPVATAPNAIVFGTGKVSVYQMATRGFALNVFGAVLIATALHVLLPLWR